MVKTTHWCYGQIVHSSNSRLSCSPTSRPHYESCLSVRPSVRLSISYGLVTRAVAMATPRKFLPEITGLKMINFTPNDGFSATNFVFLKEARGKVSERLNFSEGRITLLAPYTTSTGDFTFCLIQFAELKFGLSGVQTLAFSFRFCSVTGSAKNKVKK